MADYTPSPLALTLQKLVRDRSRAEDITERTQKYWDQLHYDAAYRGLPDMDTVSSANGRLALLPANGYDPWNSVEEAPPPDYQFNLHKRGVRQFTSLFGVRSPVTSSTPVNARNPVHVSRARLASEISETLDMVIDGRALQSRMAFILAKSGPVFLYSRWVSSGEEYGYTDIPVYGQQTMELAPPSYQCPYCQKTGFVEDLAATGGYCDCGQKISELDIDEGLSMDVEMPTGKYTQVRNGSVVCSAYTVSSVSIPPGYLSLDECPRLALIEEKDRGHLARVYGIPIDCIRPYTVSDVGDASGPQSRAQLQSYDGTSRALPTDRATEGRYWLRPSNYAYVRNDAERAELEANYPNGVKLTVVGGVPVRVEHESISDVWTMCFPEETDTNTPPPYMADTVGMSRAFNTMMEILIESALHSIPMNIYDPDVISEDILRKHGRMHASFVASKARGRDPSSGIARFYPSEFRPEMANLADIIFQRNDDVQGFQPIIWGSVAGAETAFETETARNQALAMLAQPWIQMRAAHCEARRQQIMQVAMYSDGRIHLPVSKFPAPNNVLEVASIEQLEDLLQGGWYVKSDEDLPQQPAQIRQYLREMVTNNPELAQSLGVQHPANLPLVAPYLMPIPGMRNPRLEAVQAIQQIQRDLLSGEPIQFVEGQLSPSIEFDAYLYDPTLVVDVLKPWLISEEGRREQEQNAVGWYNVRAFVEQAEGVLQQQQQQQMMQQQQQAGGGPPGGPPGGGPPLPQQQQPGQQPVPAGLM